MNDFPIERIRQKTSIIKHGLSKTSVYNSWMCMLSRCYNKKSDKYIYYGARGILVEEKWHSFLCFLDDMGFPERGMTLDRIDVNKNYCKENCRWATRLEQARNRRKRGTVKKDRPATIRGSINPCKVCGKPVKSTFSTLKLSCSHECFKQLIKNNLKRPKQLMEKNGK